ncbi:hypothetical protein AB0M95_27000 [Sphaerisporangium sp. NPDC051017]|uniref:hypothetical protein n=1 Tax=Sphaerisporangium sp. NPDC051017 TaxID=3154636 RepID=UPI00343F116F
MSQQYGGPPPQPPHPSYAPYPPYPPYPPPKKRRSAPFWLLILGLPLVLLVGCMAVVANIATTAPHKDITTAQAASSPGAQGSSDAAAAEPTAETESPTPSPSPSPLTKPKTYRGFGAKVLKIKPTEKPGLATITHRGGSNFVISTVTQDGEQQDLLVNTIGHYEGTVVYNVDAGTQTSAFKITADGAWTVVLRPLALARTSKGVALKGDGDDVVHIDPPYGGLVSMRVRHTGTSNFVVYAYHGDDGKELLINEIGRYNGEVLMPNDTFLLVIKAEAAWSMRKT